MKRINAIYGYGGFAREIMPLLNEQYPNDRNIFVIHRKFAPKTMKINNHELVIFEDLLTYNNFERFMIVSISDPSKRSLISKERNKCKLNNFNIISSKSVIMDNVEYQNGFIACPFTVLTSNIRIGLNFHLNIYSYVAHDCIIGDNVTFAPAVKCNGNVTIEDNVYVGTGAIIKNGSRERPIIIGENSVIAPGSFVTKNVEPHTTVFGNPAKKLSKSSIK